MAKRAELWQIARGVLTSFASRNNDISGYWGIGVLAQLAQEQERIQIELQLRPLQSVPGQPVLSSIAASYATERGLIVTPFVPEFGRFPEDVAVERRDAELVARADAAVVVWDGRDPSAGPETGHSK